jgi:sugar phosphate isomerase/epimerase
LSGPPKALVALDLNYPWPEADLTPKEVSEKLAEHGLAATCVTPVIYNRQHSAGSFSSPDAAIRAAARDLADESVEVATTLGARYVKFWPDQDGYDYPFQVDYGQLRRDGIGGIADVARNHPDTTLAVEYKLKEPRTRLLWSTAAATLVNIKDAGVDNLGVVIDCGHSFIRQGEPGRGTPPAAQPRPTGGYRARRQLPRVGRPIRRPRGVARSPSRAHTRSKIWLGTRVGWRSRCLTGGCGVESGR